MKRHIKSTGPRRSMRRFARRKSPEQMVFHGGDQFVPRFSVEVYALSGSNRGLAEQFEKGPCALCETPPAFFAKVALISKETETPSTHAFGICPTCAARHGSGVAEAIKEYWIGYWLQVWQAAWERAEQAATWRGGDSVKTFEVRIVDVSDAEMSWMRCVVCAQHRPASRLAFARDLASSEGILLGICSRCAAEHGTGLAEMVVRIGIAGAKRFKN